MLYLKSIVLDRFKSFNHASLSFSKGFTCIVGPNGSGKSAILDALLLGLGETSLQRLRVANLDGLISNNLKNKNKMSKAYVKMEFGGDEEITVLRVIRADGKSAYRVNGKRMSRREVVDMLSAKGIKAEDTTTIAQGEINDLIDLSPKERRELIDIAAGIREFEYKKAESLKELEKVDSRISEANVALNERMIVLRELEKEKAAAESYLKHSARLKNLKYTSLLMKKDDLQQSYDSATKEMAIIDSRMHEATRKADELSKRIEQFTAERQQLTKELNESQSSMSEVAQRMEMLNKDSVKTESELASYRSNLKGGEQASESITMELVITAKKTDANRQEIESLKTELSKVEKELEQIDIELESGDLEKRIAKLNVSVEETSAKMMDAQGYVSKLHADFSSIESAKSDYESRLKESKVSLKEKQSMAESEEKKLKESKERQAAVQKDALKIEDSIVSINKELESIDSKLIDLVQQRAIAQSREGSLSARLSDAFSEKEGFYGRASQLCTYEGKNAIAVETGAGSRFDYFVVDSMSTANKIITHLKKNSLGRATFIPMKELNFEAQRQDGSLQPLIGLVKYEGKFDKVFQYIFNNTYLIADAEDSKKFGIGKHRYVTLEGELVEQSGTISGGSQKRISLASVENSIKDFNGRKTALKSEIESSNKKLLEKRKDAASISTECISIESRMATIAAEEKSLTLQVEELAASIQKATTSMEKTRKEMEEKDKEKMELADVLAKSKSELAGLYAKSMAAGKRRKKPGNAEAEKYNALSKRVEELKIKSAQLQTENEMLEKRKKELQSEIESKSVAAKQLKEGIKERELRSEVLAKSRAEIEQKMKNSNASSKKSYERLSSMESDTAKLGADHGRVRAEIDSMSRQLGEIKLKRSSSETRLNDITLELAAYSGTLERVKGKLEEIEIEAAVVNSKITELGNVNLKAPEAYAEKKKNVDEAASKVNTLQVEKQAVLRMIEDIDSKKLQTFMHTFNEVNKNFTKLYSYIFPDTATIKLDNETDPLNSGLDISIKNGRIDRRLSSLSGGESSFVSLVLIFAIHTFNPSSLYIFDEIDSALDKENSKKLSLLIKQMAKEGQFIVVSHNDSLIVNADAAIGVVKNNSVSNAVGLEVANISSKKQ